MSKQRVKSLRFTEDEAAEISAYVKITGEPEAVLLERVSIRGLRQERLDRGLMALVETGDSSHAAVVAGVARRVLIDEAAQRGIIVGDLEPERLLADVAAVAQALHDTKLAEAVRSATDGQPRSSR